MDEINIYPRYKVGDLVRCTHVYYNYHYYYSFRSDEDEPEEDYHGIIVDIDYACWDGYEEDYEILYVIHCTDGTKRFFTEDEVYKLT